MKNQLTIILIIVWISINYAQDLKPIIDRSKMKVAAEFSGIKSLECHGLLNPPSLSLNYLPSLVKIKQRHESEDNETLAKIKEMNFRLKKQNSSAEIQNTENYSPLLKTPVVGQSLESNKNTGSTPMDNSISISSNGWIVSGANSSINYIRSGVVQYSQNFTSFLNNTFSGTCDPVVIWDPEFQRFFMYIQECGLDSDNKIALLFSKSSNPRDGWWFYSVKGDPRGGYFDYPKTGQSTNDIFLSGNAYINKKYDRSILYQINKSSGYNGQTLKYTIWDNINTEIDFTLLPLNYGFNGTYGPGIYLCSTLSGGGNAIGFFDLTDDLDKNPKLLFEKVLTESYGPGSDAEQLGSDCLLDVGDSRTQSGYYQNDRIHFVCNSIATNKWSALGYFQYNVTTKKMQYSDFGLEDWDYAYPSIAFYGKTKTDNESMIFFQRSNKENYPQSRVVYVDGNLNFSSSVYVYSRWEAECEMFGGSPNRWGDYTGITKNYSLSTPSVWVAGAYGDFDGFWNSYIAEVHDDGAIAVNDIGELQTNLDVFPNPTQSRFNIKINFTNPGIAYFKIIDYNGKLIINLMESYVSSGEHIFAFESKSLPIGSYVLQVIQNSKSISNEKLTVTR